MADIEETRAIVASGETYEGKLIPTRRAEIERPVTIHTGATVTGGVYGQSVRIAEQAIVDGPIMATESIEFSGGVVSADVGTGGKVAGTDGTVYGTITATKIALEDCVVYGNVVGQDVHLDGCLVFGIVVGERTTELHDTACYTFKSFGESVLNHVRIVLPQAIVDGPVELASSLIVLSLPAELLEEGRDGDSNLTEQDLVSHNGTQYLTLAPRLLRLSAVRDRIEAIEEMFREVVISLDQSTVENLNTEPRPYGKAWFESQFQQIEGDV